MNSEIRKTLEAVKNGELSVDDALLAIKKEPFEDIGYAKVDLHRGIRQGAAEVIYGAGKTPEQMIGIIGAMLEHEVQTILITRLMFRGILIWTNCRECGHCVWEGWHLRGMSKGLVMDEGGEDE